MNLKFRIIIAHCAFVLLVFNGTALATGIGPSASKRFDLSEIQTKINYGSLAFKPDLYATDQPSLSFSAETSAGFANSESENTENTEFRKLSTLKAIGLSALLPGAGQWYAGRRSQARIFFGVEVANWISYAGLSAFAGWKEDDFIRYANEHAGIEPDGKTDEFYRLINFYQDRDEYNALGRAFNPSAPFIPDTPENDWSWDSPESQATYRQLRNDQQSAVRNAEFMFVTAGVNRMVSVIFAWRAVRKHNNQMGSLLDDEFGTTPGKSSRQTPRQASLRLERPAPGSPAEGGFMISYRLRF